MNTFKKILFVLFAFAAQTAFTTSLRRSMATVAILTSLVTHTSAAQAASYNEEATSRLWHAIVADDLVAAQKAIDENANPNGTEKEKFLIVAVQLELFSMVKFLILHGANVNIQNRISQQTPLIAACLSGQPEIVSALLNAEANYALVDDCQRTALEWAEDAMSIHASTVKKTGYQQCINLIHEKIFYDKQK